jgi:CPA2 family monovalent cation:H+ antiporter-2
LQNIHRVWRALTVEWRRPQEFTMPNDSPPDARHLTNHVIIAGFGIVGRAVAELLDRHNVPYCVVELNAQTVGRCSRTGIAIIEGDIRDERTLMAANLPEAHAVAVALPDEKASVEAVQVIRRLNAQVKIVARTIFSSAGLLATKYGATSVVVAEQAVAKEFAHVFDTHCFSNPAPAREDARSALTPAPH